MKKGCTIINSTFPALLLLILLTMSSSCRRFIFGEIKIDHKEDPRVVVKMPSTRADIYFKEPPVVTTPNLQNPDPNGAFADWATCLVMVKEGHSHGAGKLHGNYVYAKAPWQQEEFAVIRNTPNGPVVEIDRESTVTYLEKERNIEGPNHLRVTAGAKTLWGLLFYFYDKEGKLINDKILDQSSQYQIFFSVSDLDAEGKPYVINNVRWTQEVSWANINPEGATGKVARWHSDPPEKWEVDYPIQAPVPSEYFRNKMNFKTLQQETYQIFRYTYRDTWGHEYMNDGVRNLFNIRLLPPLTKEDLNIASSDYDIDAVGLKGHLNFDFPGSEGLEGIKWPVELMPQEGDDFKSHHDRTAYLLPEFHLAVRVMKKTDGNKLVRPIPEGRDSAREGGMTVAHYTGPKDEEGWDELIRFNLPFRVFTSIYDSDPTKPANPYVPYFWQMAMEIHLNPIEVMEAANNRIIHGGNGLGGEGFGQWFL